MSGWVKIHRKIHEHALLGSNPRARFVFMELLVAAAWTDCVQDWRGRPVNVARGQAMISERALAKQTGISYQSVRTILQNLASHDLIKINALPNHGPRIVSICNYSKYQDDQRTPNAPTNAHLTHSQRTKEEGKKGRREETESFSRVRAPAQSQKQAVDDMRAALTGEVDQVVWTDDHRLKIVCPIEHAEQLKRFGGDEARLTLALEQAAGWIQPHNRSKPLIAQVRAQLAQQAARIADSDRRYKQAKAASAPLGTSNTATDADRAFLASCAKNLPTVKAVPVQEDWGID